MQFSSHQELTTDQTQARKSDAVSAFVSSSVGFGDCNTHSKTWGYSPSYGL